MIPPAPRRPVVALVVVLAVALSLTTTFTSGARAQEAAPSVPAAGIGPEGVDAAVAPLSDAQARALLIELLRERTAETPAEAPDVAVAFGSLQLRARTVVFLFGERLGAMVDALPGVGDAGRVMLRNMTDQRGWPAVAGALGVLAVMVAVGFGAVWLAGRAFAALGSRPGATATAPSAGAFVAALVGRAARAVAFIVVAYLVSFAFFERYDPLREFVTSLLLIGTAAWFAYAVIGEARAPRWGRVLAGGDSVRGLGTALATAATLAVIGHDLLKIMGLPAELAKDYLLLTGTAAFALLGTIGTRLRPDRSMATRAAVLGVLGLWLVWAANLVLNHDDGVRAAALAGTVAAGWAAVDAMIATALGIVAPAREATAAPNLWLRLGSTVRIGAAGFAAVAAGLLVLGAIGSGVMDATTSEFGRMATTAAIRIGVTLVLAYAAWQGLRFILDRHARPLGPPGEVSAPGSRLHTLLPLLRNFILIVLVVLATLIVLSSLGIDIGPLLAGAGVVGLAIGFGAQTLVRDIVSGIFFLIDDAFRIGEYVEIGSLRGTVEGMSLRSIKLRHHRGHLHTIPFGELASITNYSRDWVIMKLELNLTYDTDIDKVKKLLKRIGAEMKADPEIGPHILEPLKSQGITQMGDFALMVRAKFMAKPGEQFVIRREAFRRIKETFEANGIKFAYPTVTIHQTAPGTPGPEAAAEIAAAAGLNRPGAEPGADDSR